MTPPQTRGQTPLHLAMSSEHSGNPYYLDYSQHETSYGEYVNHGNHASDGGMIFNHYHLTLSNPPGMLRYWLIVREKYCPSEN